MLLVGIVILSLAGAAAGAGAGQSAAKSEGLHARIVAAYMDGNWDQLQQDLRLPAKQFSDLNTAQRADVLYVRQAVADCCPPWWNECKAGQGIPLELSLWGRKFEARYDPAAKNNVEVSKTGRTQTLTLSWKAADMDNPEPAEHGFRKGDLANLGIWQTLGMGWVWLELPQQAMLNLGAKEKLRFQIYSDFWGNVTGLYYASPPARRWALDIFLAAYMEKYGQGPMAGSRRAVGAMFLAEVLLAPAKYPSLKLPQKLPAESAEEKLAVYFKPKVARKDSWSIAEDKTFRQAVKSFAAANGRQVFETGKVRLPNGLFFALQSEEDPPLRAKRDAWVKTRFDRAAAK